ELAAFADTLLKTAEIPDYPNAVNGLQIGTEAEIVKLAAAVDFSGRAVQGAKKVGANFLIVHHGAFWDGLVPITGARFKILSDVLASSIGLYASHLPLDCHPTLGNNALLATRFGLKPESGFGEFKNISIGLAGHSGKSMEELM